MSGRVLIVTDNHTAPDPHLIAKLRVMDPALRASILTTKETGK